MSVRCISEVLERSGHSGTELLMLVVLADYSDDSGNSYPSVASLARKCRMSGRNANYILSALQASGELRVMKNEGPKGTNRYRIVLGALGQSAPLKPASPHRDAEALKPASPLKNSSPLKPASATPEAGFPKGVKPTSDEPSLNRQEPSDTSLRSSKLPLCPHQAIVELYHEALPELSRVKLMGEPRKKALGSFWKWVFTEKRSDGTPRARTAEEALDWIKAYFERARTNDFLMGLTERTGSHAGWKCDLDFLLTEKGKRQVIEKGASA